MSEVHISAEVQGSDIIQPITLVFNKNGGLIDKPKRQSPRDTGCSEKEHDQLFMAGVKNSKFDCENSNAMRWVKGLFAGTNVTKGLAIAMARLFAILAKIKIPREYYRRKETSILWLEEHLNDVANATLRYQIKITHCCKTILVTPPFIPSPQQLPQPQVSQSISMASSVFNTFEVDSEDESIFSFENDSQFFGLESF